MALRVLLADESTSIKKVLQLALQDFNVEVKSVPVGIDVLPLMKTWRPDIVFADVILQKKSGYEVCADIKNDPQMNQIPVVLMWSGFMEIDATKVVQCRADNQLEKPFDTETLRGIVKELIPSLKTNVMSQFLSFPNLPDFVEKQAAPPPQFTAPFSAQAKNEESDFSLAHEVDEPEDFQQIPLPKARTPGANGLQMEHTQPDHQSGQPEQWQSQSLDRFKIQIPEENYDQEEFDPSLEDAPIEVKGAGEMPLAEINSAMPNAKKRPSHSPTFSPSTQAQINPNMIDPKHLEQIIKDQLHPVLQDIAWKVIPDVVERVVKEELQKLLKDAEKLS